MSVLGPMLFLPYTTELLQLMKSHGLRPYPYANDIRSCATHEAQSLSMLLNELKLNAAITDFHWLTASRRLHQLP